MEVCYYLQFCQMQIVVYFYLLFAFMRVRLLICRVGSCNYFGNILRKETKRIMFMFNKQKGILNTLNHIFNNSLNHYCVQYICANFKCKYRGLRLWNLFWVAMRTTQHVVFKQKIIEIKAISLSAHNYLCGDQLHEDQLHEVLACHQSRHVFDEGVIIDYVTNNMTKSFNS